MQSPPPSSTHDDLLAQVGWVRAVASQIARDPHVAEELAQEALLVALATTPEAPRSMRAWLAQVVRNLGRTRRRGDRRRVAREALSSRPEGTPSTLDLVERAATQRDLVDAVLALADPYRTTLLMRFFEGLSPDEIAARTGRPASTVANHTAEGLRRVRIGLARRNGDSSALGALAPLLDWSERAPLHPALKVAMTSSVTSKLLVAGGAFTCVFALILSRPAPRDVERLSTPLQQDSNVADLQRPVDATVVTSAASLPTPERASISTSPAPARSPELSTPPPFPGRVIDALGAAVPGIEVRRMGPAMPRDAAHAGFAGFGGDGPDSVTTDALGEFEYPGSPPVHLTVGDALYGAVFEARFRDRPAAGARATIVVARRIPVEGVVVDEDGHGLEGADLLLEYSAPAATIPRELMELQSPVRHITETDALGRFQFSTALDMPGSVLTVELAGYSDARVPVPEGGDSTLRVQMTRAVPGKYVLVGHVRYADGGPAVDALVSTGSIAVPTDDRGRFLLDHQPAQAWIDHAAPLHLVAVSPGRLPATLELPSLSTILATGSPEDLVLVLEGAPLAIRGRVLDSDGAPMPGIEVIVLDTAPFGLVRLPNSRYFNQRSVEDIAGGGTVFTNRQGEFELRGLLDREYRLEALERARVLTAVSEPIRAGSRDAQLVLDTQRVGRLRGRVVDSAGLGVAGVRVSVSVERPTDLVIGPGALTDADGAFTIVGVTTNPPLLRLEGEPIVPQLFAKLPPDADREDFELRVARRCRIQFEWANWDGRADTLQLVDASGAPLPGMVLEGGLSPRDSLQVEGARSPIWTVSEEARFAVLLLAGKEVARVPVQPAREGVAVVQL